jgi:hypothetical protein
MYSGMSVYFHTHLCPQLLQDTSGSAVVFVAGTINPHMAPIRFPEMPISVECVFVDHQFRYEI